MFAAILLIELGALFVYAGVKGKSLGKLITGDNQTPAKLPSGALNPNTSPSTAPTGTGTGP